MPQDHLAVRNNLNRHEVNKIDYEILAKTEASINLFSKAFAATTICVAVSVKKAAATFIAGSYEGPRGRYSATLA